MRRGRRGFSLAEVMTAVAVAGIIAALAMPRFTTLIVALRTRSAAVRVVADLHYTRQVAAGGGGRARLVIEPSADCPGTGGGSGFRYRVVTTVQGAERVMTRVDLRRAGGRVCVLSNQSPEVVFNSRGLLVGFNNRTVIVRQGRYPPRTLTVSAVGRVLPQ